MNQHIIRTRLLALFVMLSVASCAQVTATSQPSVAIPSPTSIPPTIELPSSTPPPTSTPADTKPVWQVMENWSPANQIRAMLIDQNGDLWTGGPAGIVHWDLETNTPTVYAIESDPENTNVVDLSQTSDGMIWAGTYGNGFGRFDGKNWATFTTVNGVPGDFIVAQTVTSLGELWFTTKKDKYSMVDSHFGRFDGNNWIIEYGGAFDRLITLPDDSIVSTYNYPYHGGFFDSAIAHYDGQKWNFFNVNPDGWIFAITVAPDGAIWFATDNIVYQYVNQTWVEIVQPWTEKIFTDVSTMAISADNVAWFGFSSDDLGRTIDKCGWRVDLVEEQGTYRYDGKIWTHFTTDDGLIDNKICAITIDASGNVWFGSFDKGVSRFDGKEWTSYVIP